MTRFVELPASMAINTEGVHWALTAKPPPEAPPTSIPVKFLSIKMKEEILRITWQRKGFDFKGKRIQTDHDFAPELLRVWSDYTEAKAALKEKKTKKKTTYDFKPRFQTDFGCFITKVR